MSQFAFYPGHVLRLRAVETRGGGRKDREEPLAEMVYSEKLEKTQSIERSVIFTRGTILGFSSLPRRGNSFRPRNQKRLPCMTLRLKSNSFAISEIKLDGI